MNVVQNYIQSQFIALVNNGGVKVSEDQGNERVAICASCPFFGMVTPDPMIGQMMGCTICKCPASTKPYMKSYWRKIAVDKDLPLTATEVIEANTKRHLFPDKYELVELKCPHEDGNKWEPVDKKYK